MEENNNFRYDINSLRALAVIVVVVFHFNESLLPGGFVGVDVFFVLSGFLMTSIIVGGINSNSFNIVSFLVNRANRLLPALLFLCAILLVFGWFFLSPEDYRSVAKHTATSVTFFSNIIYWMEAGYFDAASHEKWLLHTWSLSAEWQFYMLYPLFLVAVHKTLSAKFFNRAVIVSLVVLFSISLYLSIYFPNAAYYLIFARAWEMLAGGLIFCMRSGINIRMANGMQKVGLFLIVSSAILLSSENVWPGGLALAPVTGTCLVLLSGAQHTLFSKSRILYSLGKWSYSIYLWHWPIVVFGFYFEIKGWLLFGGILSILMGSLSFKYIESIKLKKRYSILSIYKNPPAVISFFIITISSFIFLSNGVESRLPENINSTLTSGNRSLMRDKCHISSYKSPSLSCQYFEEKATWAVFGDSHVVEIAYAMATRLREYDGVRHYSYSGCQPSFGKPNEFTQCAVWYNEAAMHIASDSQIKNVILNHRYSEAFFGIDSFSYPTILEQPVTDSVLGMLESIDAVIELFAAKKEKVYVYFPVPELPRNVRTLILKQYFKNRNVEEVVGTPLAFYLKRNSLIIEHFEKASYPPNVIFIKPTDYFCDENECYAVMGGKSLYFDDDHPSVFGANVLVKDIVLSHSHTNKKKD